MELGDFFFAPIGSRSAKAMEVAFRQAAQRHDIEIAIVRMQTIEHGDCFRVTLVLFGLRSIKLNAQNRHNIQNLTFSTGKYSETRKRRYRGKSPSPPPSAPPPPPAPVPEPDRHFTREEILRRALASDD